MKIFMATMGLGIGGAETHIVELAKELKARGHEVVIASNGGVYVAEVEEAGIRHYAVPMHRRSVGDMLRSRTLLRRILREERPDIVHAHARIPAFLCGTLQRELGFPFVTSCHGVFQVSGMLKLLSNWGQRTLAVSEDIRDYLIQEYGVPAGHITLTINGIDTEKFSPEVSGAAVREEFLPRYYLDDEQIPKVIAVDELPPDADALQQALSEKRGSEVQLYVPQRGDKAHLVEMAHTNAVERLARESGRYAREEKLLDEMAQVLGLPKPPRTIESYDISNWGDGTSVCGMVTFRDGKPYKAGYRKFRMKTVAGTDDYASLAETVSRRAAEYEKYSGMAANGEPSSNYFGQKPDLLLMDGGRGQVSAAKAALAGTALADVPLYGMVKDDHHRTRAIVDSEGREIAINMNRGTFTFVTAIQDETHRFANAYRKQQMKQKSYSSTLTEVPGVGPKTAKALMAQFKSVGAVKEATPDQLENTPGVGRQMAQTIYEYFHPQG